MIMELLPQDTFEFSRLFVLSPESVNKMDFNISFDICDQRKRNSSFIQDTFSPNSKRRKFSTKNCQECEICSDQVFEVRFVKQVSEIF